MLIAGIGMLCFPGLSQPEMRKDSLLNLLPAAKDDSTKIMLLLKVSAVYATRNFDSSFYI